MKPVTFITGNQNKISFLEKYLDHPIKHIKLDLDELQTLDIQKLVEHKAKQAYEEVQEPVLVEDSSLEFLAFGGLPGPFVKFFVDNIPFDTICSMLDGKDRAAVARSTFGYYDGENLTFFEGKLDGIIAKAPAGDRGWDWDQFFIPAGYDKTRAQCTEEEYQETSMQLRPLAALKEFLLEI